MSSIAAIYAQSNWSPGWEMVAALAVVLQTLVIAAAAVLALRQLKESRQLRGLEGLSQLHGELRASRNDRLWLYQNLSGDPSNATEEEWRRINDVATLFDRIAQLCEHDLVPENALLRSHGFAIARLWRLVAPYVKHERSNDAHKVGHVRGFEELAGRALQNLDREQRSAFEEGATPQEISDRSS